MSWDGWDVVEMYDRRLDHGLDEDGPFELTAHVVSQALLTELERPPWWREIEADRRALRKEIS